MMSVDKEYLKPSRSSYTEKCFKVCTGRSKFQVPIVKQGTKSTRVTNASAGENYSMRNFKTYQEDNLYQNHFQMIRPSYTQVHIYFAYFTRFCSL